MSTIPVRLAAEYHPKIETHYHFICWGYERIEAGTGNYVDNVVIDLIASSSEEALVRARQLVPGKHGYCVRNLIEHFDSQCQSHMH